LLVIIQARSNSHRFKNKIMKLIYGKPMIWHLIERIKKARRVSSIIVATSDNKTDDNFVKFLKKNKYKFFRGSLDNVAKRMHEAANKNFFFMRISGDSPLIDPKIIDKAITLHYQSNKKHDLITNIYPRTYPKGQSVEIIKRSKLKKVLEFMNKDEMEHVTKYFYNNSRKFKIKNFKSDIANYSVNLCIDTIEDFKSLTKKYKKTFIENINNYEN